MLVEQGLAKVSHSRSDCPNLIGTYDENDQGKFSQKRIDTFSTESGLILDDSGSIFKIEGTRLQVNQPENGSYIGYCHSGKIVIDLYQGSVLLGRMTYSPHKENRTLKIELTSLSSQFESRSETWSKKQLFILLNFNASRA